MSIILASQSPRRQALLEQIGLSFRVLSAKGEEIIDPSLPPHQLVQQLSKQKAQEVSFQTGPNDLIIAADTIVVLDHKILGKPKGYEEAKEMLQSLSGRTHIVYTGICLLQGNRCVTDVVETSVSFRTLSDHEIEVYIRSGEPMDKAGAYGIQGKGALFVSQIQGDFYSVMGLPLCRLSEHLSQFGISPFDLVAASQESKEDGI